MLRFCINLRTIFFGIFGEEEEEEEEEKRSSPFFFPKEKTKEERQNSLVLLLFVGKKKDINAHGVQKSAKANNPGNDDDDDDDDGAAGRRKGSGTEVASLVCAPGRGRVRHLFIRAQSTGTHRIVFALVLLPMRFRMVSSGNEVPDV